MNRFIICLIAALGLSLVAPGEPRAFEYLEHSYLTDRACQQAKERLGPLIEARPDDPDIQARYLALALVCPNRRIDEYCIDQNKAVTAPIEDVGQRPWNASDFPLTLGDVSALNDHVSRLGPIDGLSGAERPGLTRDLLDWFADDEPSVDSTVERVGSQGCTNAENVPWRRVEEDVEAVADGLFETGRPVGIPSELLSPMARSSIIHGTEDPSVRYTMSNPHYLDLVLRNHNHFGEEAFDTWLGYHSASLNIAGRRCEQSWAMGPDATEEIAGELKQFEDIDFDALTDDERAELGCAAVGDHIRRGLLDWAERTEDEPPGPIADFIDRLRGFSEQADPVEIIGLRRDLDRIGAALKSLVFQASGLHYLQDGFAGGHVRTIRTRGGLAEARHDHDYDNEEGLSVVLRTRAGDFPFVAFGDQFLLGDQGFRPDDCDWHQLAAEAGTGAEDPDRVAACLLRYQRGLVVAVSTAGLIDWAVGGMMDDPVDPARCEASDTESAVCDLLPLTPVSTPGALPARNVDETTGLRPGNMPVPPPPFSYESLVTTVGFDIGGSATQYGLQLTMLTEFDRFAHWLTSWRVGIGATNITDDNRQIVGRLSHNFHYRFSARVMFEGGLFGMAGLEGSGDSLSFIGGGGPAVGITALPEGWLKIPLELSTSFRVPMTFFTSGHGFSSDSLGIDGYWFQLGLGLAFM